MAEKSPANASQLVVTVKYDYPVYLSAADAASLAAYLTEAAKGGKTVKLLTPASVGMAMNALGLGLTPGTEETHFVNRPASRVELREFVSSAMKAHPALETPIWKKGTDGP